MKNNKWDYSHVNCKKDQLNKENVPTRIKSQKLKTIQQSGDKYTNPHYIYTNLKPLKGSKSDINKIQPTKLKNKDNVKFPPIFSQMNHYTSSKSPKARPTPFRNLSSNQKQSHSMKRINTQNTYLQQTLHSKSTTKREQNIKQTLLKIMQQKQGRQLLSIDQEIDKLDSLTKRYSHLRKDLVSIEQDLMTISFKRMMRNASPENFLINHSKSNNVSLVRGTFQ